MFYGKEIKNTVHFDIAVVGGGVAGFCAFCPAKA